MAILRTDKDLMKYIGDGNTFGMATVELRAWYNPMRLFWGSCYYVTQK